MPDPAIMDEELFEEEKNGDQVPADLPADSRRIYAKSSDPTVRELYDRHKDGDLTLQPDFQRQFVWDTKKASRLIESVLLDVPLPMIYLARNRMGKNQLWTDNNG